MDAKNWIKGALCREKHVNGDKIQKTAKIRGPERERERLKSRCKKKKVDALVLEGIPALSSTQI